MRISHIIGSGLLVLLVPALAFGHAVASNHNPRANANLQVAPKKISVSLNEDVEATESELVLFDSAGKVRSGTTRVEGRTLAAPVRGLTAGRYAYTYEVTSADGHVVRSAVAFSIRALTPTSTPTTITLEGRQLRLSGARVGFRNLRLWGGLQEGTVEWSHPSLPAPLVWNFQRSAASGLLPFAGTYTVRVRALVGGFNEKVVSGQVTIAGEARPSIDSRRRAISSVG